MGASNMLTRAAAHPVTRRLLMRAAEIYAERFAGADGRVPATFEILTLTAWAPDESQQKPLRPGSAQGAACRRARRARAQAARVAAQPSRSRSGAISGSSAGGIG